MKKIVLFSILLSLLTLVGGKVRAGNITPMTFSPETSISVVDNFSVANPAWKGFEGQWVFVDKTLRQISLDDYYPLILRFDQQYEDVDVRVDFKPLAGRIDASGGIVFRAQDKNNYYIVRANALEDNFRLYTVKNGVRKQIASARVAAPELSKYHHLRVVVQGDHIQAYLDNILYLDHRDGSFVRGYVGLWTKADSVTEFDNFQVIGTPDR